MTELDGIAADLACAWGTLAVPPRLVVRRENAVFEVRFADGRKGALRLHRAGYQTTDAIRSELLWTERLVEVGFPCPVPMRTREGTLIAERDGMPVASLIDWIEATPICDMYEDDGPPPESYREVGALIGALHRVTDTLDVTGISRPAWSCETLLGEAPLWGRFWENPALSESERGVVLEARAEAKARLDAMEAPDIGLIHADLLQENILSDGNGLWLIDFDDAGFGYRLYDLGTAMIQHINDPQYELIMEALIDGYASERGVVITKSDLQLFTLLRGFASCGWCISRMDKKDSVLRLYAERAVRMAEAFLS